MINPCQYASAIVCFINITDTNININKNVLSTSLNKCIVYGLAQINLMPYNRNKCVECVVK